MNKSPDAFRTISEVADWLDTPAHVLRFWESKFLQVKPVKRAGGRRYYRPTDMQLLGGLKRLLHEDGMTIRAAQGLLREKGAKHVCELSAPLDSEIQATLVEAVDVAVAEPANSDHAPSEAARTGVPPASLKAAEEAFTSSRKAREDAQDVETDLPFFRPRDSVPAPGPARSADAPDAGEHFLRAAPTALDAHSDGTAAAAPETIAEPEDLPPTGPVRTDLLREALMAPGGIDPSTLVALHARLNSLRVRMADGLG